MGKRKSPMKKLMAQMAAAQAAQTLAAQTLAAHTTNPEGIAAQGIAAQVIVLQQQVASLQAQLAAHKKAAQSPAVVTEEQKEKNLYNAWLSQKQQMMMREKIYEADKTTLSSRAAETMVGDQSMSSQQLLLELKNTYNTATDALKQSIAGCEGKLQREEMTREQYKRALKDAYLQANHMIRDFKRKIHLTGKLSKEEMKAISKHVAEDPENSLESWKSRGGHKHPVGGLPTFEKRMEVRGLWGDNL